MTRKKEKFFWQYLSAMVDLGISRRTLQRWIDELHIKPMEFEDHMKVFLSIHNMHELRLYRRFMQTRNHSLINRYRDAYNTSNAKRIENLMAELEVFYSESTVPDKLEEE